MSENNELLDQHCKDTVISSGNNLLKHCLYINIEKTYDARLLYTAISRATRLDQIYLVKN